MATEDFRRKYLASFKKFDKDSSGNISLQELIGVLEDLGKNTDPSLVEKVFNETDKDGSGSIDEEEFMRMMDQFDHAWIRVQQKTFTRWANTCLSEMLIKIDDLGTDFRDGVNLIPLIEILSKKSIGKYNKKPKMRVMRCENLGKALRFLESEGIKLTNIGPDDIEEGNLKITLGLIWALILHYQIGEGVAEGSPKWALLEWVKKQIAPYGIGKDLKNFKFGWDDGKVFSALCDSVGPAMNQTIDYNNLDDSPYVRMQTVLDTAEKKI